MKTEDVKRIIGTEQLDTPIWGDSPANRCDVIGIAVNGSGWFTYFTDERGATEQGSIRKFSSESAALEDLLDGLRSLKSDL
ncbi:MAG: hypothetical protein ACRCSP_06495 [Rhodoglobus sp.]